MTSKPHDKPKTPTGNDADSDDPFAETTFYQSDALGILDDELEDQAPPCLVLMAGPTDQTGRQWILNSASTILGRSQTADIQINEISLSKSHARFESQESISGHQEITIMDLGSTNQTYLNEVALIPKKTYTLKNNDKIKAGSLIFKFLERGILSETSEKARMQSELETMKIIQERFLPGKQEARYNWLSIRGDYRPASESSGDWWWHWTCAQHAFVIIADTTGHGAAAALITSAARAAVASLEDDVSADLERIYNRLTHTIRKVSGGQLSMSAFIIDIDLNTRLLRYINASHIPATVINKKQPLVNWKSLEYLSPRISPALGSTDLQFIIGEKTLESACRIVLVTDGLTERGDINDQPLSQRAFDNLLLESHVDFPDNQREFANSFMRRVDEWAAPAIQKDDITIVVLDADESNLPAR